MKEQIDRDRQEMIEVMTDQVTQIWRASRENLVAMLREQGRLREEARAAATNWLEMRERLQKEEGLPLIMADNEARREWVVLPDLGEMEEYDSPDWPEPL